MYTKNNAGIIMEASNMVNTYRKFYNTKLFLLLTAICFVFAGNVMAIDVPDGDFETPELDDNSWAYVNDIASSWIVTVYGGTPWMGNNYSGGGVYPGMGHTGAQWVDMNYSYLHQSLGETYSEGVTYVLSAWATTSAEGERLFGYFTVDGNDGWTDATVLDSETLTVPVSDDHSWNQLNYAYTATAEDAGKDIGICLFGDYSTWVDDVVVELARYAVGYNPGNGDDLVATTTSFDWYPPSAYTATSYDLEYRTDPNFASGGTVVVEDLTEETYTPGDALDFETTYYWRVKSYGDTEPVDSPVFSFTTAPAVPVITGDPDTQVVAEGESVTFTIEATNGESYQWYKDGGKIDGAEDVSYTIDSVVLGDEGGYYCKAINTQGFDDSSEAFLITERLIGHWKLDGDLMDSASGFDATAGSAVYGAGLVEGGQALSLGGIDPNQVAYVSNTAFLNTNQFTVSLWAKVAGGAGSYRSPVTSRMEPPTSGYIIYATSGDKWEYWTGAGTGWTSTGSGEAVTDVVEGEWIFLTATYDESTLTQKLYVNGLFVSETVLGSPIPLNMETALKIGCGGSIDENPEYIFNGMIDDVRYWSYALDSFAVAQLYVDVDTEATFCVETPEFDYNDDCLVDMLDFAVFASTWLDCNVAPDCLDQHEYNID